MSSRTPWTQLPRDEAVLEHRAHLRHRHGRRHQRAQHRQMRALGFEDHLAERPQAPGNQDARHFVVLAHLAHGIGAIDGIEAFQVADLAVAEDEDASFAEVLVEAREGQAGLLDVRAQDPAIEAAATREELEIQPQRFGAALEKRADRHACRHRLSFTTEAEMPLSRSAPRTRRPPLRGDRQRAQRRRRPFSRLPLAFHLVGLLQDLLDRLRHRRAPRVVDPTPWRMWSCRAWTVSSTT